MVYPSKIKLVLRSDLSVPVTPREGTIPTNVADNKREVKGQALFKLSHESSYSPERMTSLILSLYDPLLQQLLRMNPTNESYNLGCSI